jgi:hypothetical protein
MLMPDAKAESADPGSAAGDSDSADQPESTPEEPSPTATAPATAASAAILNGANPSGVAVPRGAEQIASTSSAGTLAWAGKWSVTTRVHGAMSEGANGALTCEVDPDGAFRCRDRCGANAGQLVITDAGVEQRYQRLCGKPKTIVLRYRAENLSEQGFLLNRERDEQEWKRFAPPNSVTAPFVENELAPEDVGFRDQAGGRRWGDRCYLHIKAGRLKYAGAACRAGLAMKPTDAWVHGALLFNMGLIAEKEGNLAQAKDWYQQSLAVRPTGLGSSAVRAALAKLNAGSQP